MTASLRLILFDVDGTLVDSQGAIVTAMTEAFARAGEPPPARAAILGGVGLSLDVAIPRLAPALSDAAHVDIVAWYKAAYMRLRANAGAARSAPLYPFARETLAALHAVPENLLGVATGKSRRGLDALLDAHDLRHLFVTRQVSDHHPSKPHPSMIQAALSETGVAPAQAVMIGDTSYDIEMARAAGIASVAVSWGYHRRAALAGADAIVDDFNALPAVLGKLTEAVR